MTFLNDLKFGEKYQLKFIKMINAKDYTIMEGKFTEYDIIIRECIFDEILTLYYEIKCDRNAYTYNQFFIEFECNNKPSGIQTTKADYYGIFVPYYEKKEADLYIIPVNEIKKIINNNKNITIKEGGYKKLSKGYIIDISFFSKYKFYNN